MIAGARLEDDKDAAAGLLPIAGAVLWASSDSDDKFLEDGWDWLALVDSLSQLAGFAEWMHGLMADAPAKKTPDKTVMIKPVSQPGYGGFSVVGTF